MFGEFMPSSKLASTFVLAFIEGRGFHAIKSPVIFYTNFHENSGEIMLNEPRLPASIVLAERRSGSSDHDKKKRVLLDPVLTAG